MNTDQLDFMYNIFVDQKITEYEEDKFFDFFIFDEFDQTDKRKSMIQA